MPRSSAGLLLYRVRSGVVEVLLAHPGGPFWARKDLGAWTIPKGEVHDHEDLLAAARREFQEETGIAPQKPFAALGEVRQKSGKRVHIWAVAGDCDPAACVSNDCTVEWPPGSGRQRTFPEIDRVAFFPLDVARRKLLASQVPFLDRLAAALG